MSVRLEEIVFRNNNGVEVLLTIEAPVGHTVVQQHPVGPNATYRVQPGVDGCADVLLVAKPAYHDADRQKFTVAGTLTPAYLKHVATQHNIGSIHGSVTSATELA